MKKLLKELDDALEQTKDFNLFKHLFSNDEGTKTLAKLRRTIKTIKFKAQITSFKDHVFPEGRPINETRNTGSFVSIRPCADEFSNKTYLGILIGDAALSSQISIKDDAILCSWAHYNPAILIPELGKVIYGSESWWSIIESEKDLNDISDLDIENVWYMKALKQLSSSNEEIENA